MSIALTTVVLLAALATGMYIFLISLISFGWFVIPAYRNRTTAKAKISVVVAVRNEAGNIRNLLEALRHQTYPPELTEIIISDDQSTDETLAVVSGWRLTHPEVNLRIVKSGSGESSKKAAIDRGIAHSSGNIILCTDADCVPSSDWIAVLAGGLECQGVQFVFGPVRFYHEAGLFRNVQALEFLSLVGSGAGLAGSRVPVMCNAANMGFAKNAYLAAAGSRKDSHIASGDDVFLMHSIRRLYGPSAIRFVKSAHAMVDTQPPPDMGTFFRQRIRWASKGKSYRDFFAVYTSLSVYIFSTLLLGCATAGIFQKQLLYMATAMFVIKTLADFPFMMAYSLFSSRTGLMLLYIPMQIIYPLYVVIVGSLSPWLRVVWKGRRHPA